MAADITIACGNVENGSGTIRATIDAVHMTATGLEVNNDDGTQKLYRFRVDPPSGDEPETWSGYSQLFSPSHDGKGYWEGYIFPTAGSWTVRVHDEELDSDAATESVTVV